MIFNVQQIEEIRGYFGANIAIHFAFRQYLTVGLMVASIISMICYSISNCCSIRSEFEYPKLEICAGMYDAYPRCPLNGSATFTLFSDWCEYKNSYYRTNLSFAFLMSVWCVCFNYAFKNYLAKLTQYWEQPYTKKKQLFTVKVCHIIYHLSLCVY